MLYVVVALAADHAGRPPWYIQVLNGTSYAKLASQNQTRNIVVPAVRGQILDDVGNTLVTNHTKLVVSVDMMTCPSGSRRRRGGAEAAGAPARTRRTSC